MSRIARRVTVPVVGTALLVVIGAGVALAYYRSGVAATGTGSAGASGLQTVTMSVTGTVSTGLYPGGPGADVTVSVHNPYTQPVTLTGITAAGSIVVTGGSGCTTTGVALATPSAGLPATVNAGATSTITLTAAVTMSAASDSGCQGASFAVPFQIAGRL